MTTRIGRRTLRRASSIGEATQLCLEFAMKKHKTTNMLITFNDHGKDGDETTAALTVLMGEIGWHRANVERCTQPDLPLFGDDA